MPLMLLYQYACSICYLQARLRLQAHMRLPPSRLALALALVACLTAASLDPALAGPKAKKPPPVGPVASPAPSPSKSPKPTPTPKGSPAPTFPPPPPDRGVRSAPWSCVFGVDYPVRLNSQLDVECYSDDGRTCSGQFYCDNRLGIIYEIYGSLSSRTLELTPVERGRLLQGVTGGLSFTVPNSILNKYLGLLGGSASPAPSPPPSTPPPSPPAPQVPRACGAMMKGTDGKTGYEDFNGWCWQGWYGLMHQAAISPWFCPPASLGLSLGPIRFIGLGYNAAASRLIDVQCYSTDGKTCAKGPCNKKKLDEAAKNEYGSAKPINCVCTPDGPNKEYCANPTSRGGRELVVAEADTSRGHRHRRSLQQGGMIKGGGIVGGIDVINGGVISKLSPDPPSPPPRPPPPIPDPVVPPWCQSLWNNTEVFKAMSTYVVLLQRGGL